MAIFGGNSGEGLNIQATLEADQAITEAEKLDKALQGAGKSAEEFGKKTDTSKGVLSGTVEVIGKIGIGLGKLGAAYTGVITVASGFVAVVQKMADAGEVFSSMKDGFESMGGSMSVIDQAREKTIGLASNMDLLKLANKAMVAGLPDMNANFADIADLGARLANTLGRDTVPTIEALTQAIATGRTMQLQQLGLFVDGEKAAQTYADKMGIVGRSLTELEKKAATQAEAMRLVKEKLEEIPAVTDSVANASTALSNKFSDIFTTFSVGINANEELTGGFRDLEKTISDIDLEEFGNSVASLTANLMDLVAWTVKAGVGFVNDFSRGLKIVGEVSAQAGKAIAPLLDAWGTMLKLSVGIYPSLSEMRSVMKGLGTIEMPSMAKAAAKVNEEIAVQLDASKKAVTQNAVVVKTTKEITEGLKKEGDAREALKQKTDKEKKAKEELAKVALKASEDAKKALDDLKKELRDTTSKDTIDALSDQLKKAMELKDTGLATQLREMIYQNVRKGVEQGFVDAGGSLNDVGAQDTVTALAVKQTDKIYNSTKEGVDKGLKDGLLESQLPNYLSEMITNSLIDGFTNGLNSDTLLSAGKSLSSIFAQNFQESFAKLFSSKDGGGFTTENIVGSLSNLGIAYGVNSLAQNLSDNKRDPVNGIVGGAVLGASIGSVVPVIGTGVGAVIGAGVGYAAGTLGPSTNSDTVNRHDTVNFIEQLLNDRAGSLSFLQNGNNIQEGGITRFNTTSDGNFVQSLGEAIVDGIGYYYGGVYTGIYQGVTGNTPHDVGADTLASAPPEVGSIQGPGWADQYWAQFGQQGGEAFQGLGAAFSEMAGTMGPQMEQIGVILAENLNGNLDTARMLLVALGIGAEDLEASFIRIGLSGEESWHTIEVWMQRIPELTGEGLIGIGDLDGAMMQFINSGGRGQEALISLRNIGIEAMESGATSMDELRAHLEASGKYSTEQINAFMTALSQRGITSLEQLRDASDRELGGVTADTESLGFAFEDAIGGGVDGAIDSVNELKQAIEEMPDQIEKRLVLKVSTKFEDSQAEAVYNDATQEKNSRSRGVPRQ